jgi:uracil-DNA glycosylase family 4
MMEKMRIIKRLWDVLNLIEDHVTCGFKRQHPQLTELVLNRKETDKFPVDRKKQLEELASTISRCMKCHLQYSRRQTVAGEGVLDPLLFIIGEGPGEEEDKTGHPFIGKAGKYLDKWLAAIGLDRHTNCFISNIVKCRPPHNRDPREEESSACLPYLEKQISIVKPRALLCVGRIASQILTGRLSTSIRVIRDSQYRYRGIPLIATFHPSAVLRDQSLRQPVWEDLKQLKKILEESEE